MTEAEHAVREAAAGIPAEVRARFETAADLSDEDRKAIIDDRPPSARAFPAQAEHAKPEPNRAQPEPRPKAELESRGARGEAMSDTTASLRRKIGSAGDLQSVVRTMKALAASSIGQYERSVRALADYYRTVELGLGACFREERAARP